MTKWHSRIIYKTFFPGVEPRQQTCYLFHAELNACFLQKAYISIITYIVGIVLSWIKKKSKWENDPFALSLCWKRISCRKMPCNGVILNRWLCEQVTGFSAWWIGVCKLGLFDHLLHHSPKNREFAHKAFDHADYVLTGHVRATNTVANFDVCAKKKYFLNSGLPSDI